MFTWPQRTFFFLIKSGNEKPTQDHKIFKKIISKTLIFKKSFIFTQMSEELIKITLVFSYGDIELFYLL